MILVSIIGLSGSSVQKMVERNQKREQKTRSLILDSLSKNDTGLSISDLSRMLEKHYTTISKYVAVLEAEGKIIHREFGMAKVFRLEKGRDAR